jgi:outer membrane immunogenic protein
MLEVLIMKSIVRGALAIALLGSVAVPAFAADLPSRKEAPVYIAPAPVFSWTGFYVGAEVGGQFGNDKTFIGVNGLYNTTPGASYTTSGVTGGGLVGYNYQINQFVLGLEADVTGSSTQGRYSAALLPVSAETQYGFGSSVRGRLGWAFDRTLVYAAGGWAGEDIKHTYTAGVLGLASISDSTFRSGYTIGGGIDYAFNYNWIGRIEYRYNDYGKYVQNAAYGVNSILNVQQHPTDNIIQAALIYKFGAPAPVVAKY